MFNYSKCLFITCFFFLLTIILTSQVAAQVTAERILPTQGYLPGQTIIVEIQIQVEPGVYSIVETPPADWKVSVINSAGKFENGLIKWTLTAPKALRYSLSYWLSVPEDATGSQDFTGIVNGQPVTGQTTLEPHIPEPVGIFSDHIDLMGKGEPLGSAAYNSATDEYEIVGGENIPWDWSLYYLCGHIAYKQLWGNATITAKIRPIRLVSSNGWAAAAVGFLDSLTQRSKCFFEKAYVGKYVEIIWRSRDNVSLSWDFGHGEKVSPLDDDRVLFDEHLQVKIQRQNNQCTAYYRFTQDDEWTERATFTIDFEDPFIVVLAVWPIDSNVLCKGVYSEVELIEESVSSVQDWALF